MLVPILSAIALLLTVTAIAVRVRRKARERHVRYIAGWEARTQRFLSDDWQRECARQQRVIGAIESTETSRHTKP